LQLQLQEGISVDNIEGDDRCWATLRSDDPVPAIQIWSANPGAEQGSSPAGSDVIVHCILRGMVGGADATMSLDRDDLGAAIGTLRDVTERSAAGADWSSWDARLSLSVRVSYAEFGPPVLCKACFSDSHVGQGGLAATESYGIELTTDLGWLRQFVDGLDRIAASYDREGNDFREV
jgi:hypothetical protein